jgi:hypothetical protein
MSPMSITYSATISQSLRDRFETTDRCKPIRANQSVSGSSWDVEHIRELRGCLEAWLFRRSPGKAQPDEHIHVTLHPDRSESVVGIHFGIAGGDRLRTQDYPHGPASPN